MDQKGNSLNAQMEGKAIYLTGALATIMVLAGIILDIIAGNITGGDIASLPRTAVERFAQFRENTLLGLYNLDLLNTINQIVLIPVYFALFVAHRKKCSLWAAFSLVVFLVGTTLFVAGNSALSMLSLSREYALAGSEEQKALFAAAGEAMLAKGAHGSPGIFIGFLLPNIAGIMMSLVMLKGGVFSKTTAFLGIAGGFLLCVYVILVTFVKAIGSMTMAFAMPGGLLTMAWMVMIAIRLFHLAGKNRVAE